MVCSSLITIEIRYGVRLYLSVECRVRTWPNVSDSVYRQHRSCSYVNSYD